MKSFSLCVNMGGFFRGRLPFSTSDAALLSYRFHCSDFVIAFFRCRLFMRAPFRIVELPRQIPCVPLQPCYDRRGNLEGRVNPHEIVMDEG